MSLDFTPLLTAHLFVADTVLKKELERFVERMEESHITVNQYAAGHPLQETFFQGPHIYISLGEGWGAFSALIELPKHEKNAGCTFIHLTKFSLNIYFSAGSKLQTLSQRIG